MFFLVLFPRRGSKYKLKDQWLEGDWVISLGPMNFRLDHIHKIPEYQKMVTRDLSELSIQLWASMCLVH